MANVINDLEDKTSRLALAYGRHAVKGFLTKHVVENVGTQTQVTLQQALGQGMWYDRATGTFRVTAGTRLRSFTTPAKR